MADFIHLAVYHKRDIFAASPVGISPRTWDPDSMHPALATPHQQLSDSHSPQRAGRAAWHSPVGAKTAHADMLDSEQAKIDADMERVRKMEIPEMEKWAQLLQNGGVLLVVLHICCLFVGHGDVMMSFQLRFYAVVF